jgi:hypothetical protein
MDETPEPAAEAAPVEEQVVPEPEPEPIAPKSNANLQVTAQFVDGTSRSGHVVRIERAVDTYGESGWTDQAADLKFYVEGNDEYKKINWTDVVSIKTVLPDKKDFDCLYQSDFTPWMYECSVKVHTELTTKDGKRYTADAPKKWRFIFDDDSTLEFWMKRHYARAQDERVVGLDDTNPENYDLYGQLQDELRASIETLHTTVKFR